MSHWQQEKLLLQVIANQNDIKFLTIMNPNMYFRSEQQSKEHQVQACAGATKVPKASVQ
jgi:hypothetical protein